MNCKLPSVSEIEGVLKNAAPKELESLFALYQADLRPGVQKVIEKYQKKLEKYKIEVERIYAMQEYERTYSEYAVIAGMDEVGRGPLAGPVVTCAIILPKNSKLLYVNDSKKLSEKMREELFPQIIKECISYGIGIVSPERIDEINILNATYEAMRESIANLSVKPDLLLNDAVTVPGIDIKQVPIIKGDAKCLSIAAASIVAKVTRDHMMEEYDTMYPGYGFAGNKGYGSAEHIKALRKLGPTPIHRKSFIKNFVS